ncbi:XRE family transcriptional regulator [Proteus vulgaris]|uniref:XRE family transcriptional regulator n=1 Tax=Proteus faecis TaxID=2050967 RepID=UPI00163CCD84|nr:XRE family transcriptional regulator [Proteus faecis]MCT8249146.1 XRE family transcriptional regulator [Proteus faecis]QNH66053.1 XRE family transcriptional regulator [Proteus vulgaris]
MEYDELKRQIGKAGLTNKAFAELIGINPNSVTNFKVRGVVPSHIAVIATLMAEMKERGIDFEEIIKKAGRT